MKRIAALVCLLTLCPFTSAQNAKRVSVAEAKKLVLAALPSKTKLLPKFELEEYEKPESPQFYFFQALWAGTPNGSVVVGHYAVDKETADVWNAPAACVEMSTPALHKLQAKVRSRIGLSPTNYRKVKRRCPLEMEDEVSGSKQ